MEVQATWPSAFITERLRISLGDPKQDEISYRACTYAAFSTALHKARQPGRDICEVPRAGRNTGVAFHKIFKRWRSAFAGYSFDADGSIVFSFAVAKSECPLEFLTADVDAPTCFILPLEEVAVLSALAALQVYCRSKDYSGTFSCSDVCEVLAIAGLAVGRSSMPGSITSKDIEKMLSQNSHAGVGLADVLLLLRDWQNHGSVLHFRLPPEWVIPSAPMALAWPSFSLAPPVPLW